MNVCLTRLAGAMLMVSACGDGPPRDASGGTLLIATGADAEALLPPLVASTVGRQVADALFLPIARIGDDLNLVGDEGFTAALASQWEWAADSLSIVFHIDPRARWHDGAPVRAADVLYTLKAYRAPAVSADKAPALASIDSITVRDSLTFVTWYRHRTATQFYDLVYNLTPIPAHVYSAIPFDSLAAAPAARQPVGSGKFRFARWQPGERVEVVADTSHWEGRPKLDRIVWLPVAEPTTQVAKLLAGEADMVEILRGDALHAVGADSSIRLIRRPEFLYANAVFNLRDPKTPSRPHRLFGERGLRRALSMALDRATLVGNVLDSLGAPMSSPYLSALALKADLLPYDVARAARLLDSLGWRDQNGDGIREKDGNELAFKLSAPSSSAARSRAAIVMMNLFKGVGARVEVDNPENAVFMANNEAGKFDIALLGYTGSPAPSAIRQYWSSNQQGQGSNWGTYHNPAFDAVIDSAVRSTRAAEARTLYERAGQLLADDAPAIWLYELRSFSGLNDRFRTAPMRPDAWWAHLDAWSVDPARMIDRDRIGPGVVPR
ncbi:MAG: ABC transporter substrate-binding protein [Gemmatimonadaceae bacterium]